jgi:hypothetical protein
VPGTDLSTAPSKDAVKVGMLCEFRWEMWLMSAVQHPNMVKLEGYSVSPAAIPMEVVSGGDLFEKLRDPCELKLDGLLCGYKEDVLSIPNLIAFGHLEAKTEFELIGSAFCEQSVSVAVGSWDRTLSV